MTHLLIYAPELVGHPRVYCRVIADALRDDACQIDLALGLDEKVNVGTSPDLQPLVGRPRVSLFPTRDASATGSRFLRAEELLGLQERRQTDCTLFIEADKSEIELRRIATGAAPRLRGRNLGIFANTAEWYPGEDSFTGEPKAIRAKTLRTTLGNIKRLVLHRRRSARYFYEKVVLGKGVLDAIIVKDERLAAWFGPPVLWMPEISRPATTPESDADREAHQSISLAYSKFLTDNAGKEPTLYFGDAAYYKGYDLFLEYLCREPEVCGVHAGQTYDAQQRGFFRCDVEQLRQELRAEGRLFETNAYVHTQRLKELFFGSVPRYLTTHRLTLSSSTTLQALELGKPLLVPDRGLLGYRVRQNGLGRTYRYGDLDDLMVQARAFRAEAPTKYEAPIRAFSAQFSDDAIARFFRQTLLRP